MTETDVEGEVRYEREVQVGFRCNQAEYRMLVELSEAFHLRTSEMLRTMIRQTHQSLQKAKATGAPRTRRKAKKAS